MLKRVFFAISSLICFSSAPGFSEVLTFSFKSPNFGGVNSTAMSMAQQERGLKAAIIANEATKLAAIQAELDAADAKENALVNSILSQLNGLVAYKIANEIVSSTNGQADSFQQGNNTISFINSSGVLSITINSPSGTTSITVPSL